MRYGTASAWPRLARGRVSGTTTRTAKSITTHRPVTIQSIPRHPIGSESRPPTSGARTGATPPTVSISVNAFAAARPVTRSAITARPITMPPAPERPCASLAAISTGRLGAKADATPASTQTAALTTRGVAAEVARDRREPRKVEVRGDRRERPQQRQGQQQRKPDPGAVRPAGDVGTGGFDQTLT